MNFIFEADQKALRRGIIDLLALHCEPEAGRPRIDILTIGLKFGNQTWFHPDKPRQIRGGPITTMLTVAPEHDQQAQNLLSDFQLLEKDTRRAHKTLTQLVRGVNTEQDLRDSLPDCLTLKLGFNHLPRTRDPGFRYVTMEPRIYSNILKDLDMIEGYFNARLFL
jgi:hypothetical protein